MKYKIVLKRQSGEEYTQESQDQKFIESYIQAVIHEAEYNKDPYTIKIEIDKGEIKNETLFNN